MSFQRYESYRDCGVEWPGQLPSHWQSTRLRFVADLNPSKSEVSELPDNQELNFLPMEAVGEKGELDLSRTRSVGELRNGYSYFADGDVVFAKVTPCLENGKGALIAGLIGGKGFGTTELTVLRPRDRVDGPFLRWLTFSHVFRGPAEGEMVGAGGLKRVPDDFVADFPAPWPPPRERRDIAAFLDRETAKIDTLVEAQRRLIELLKEKRQAVISHAVTKGLDPSARMKDSGVEWLGEVPAHWEVAPLKRAWSVTDCKHVTAEFVDDGLPLASIREVQARYVDLSAAKQTTEGYYEQLVEGGRRPVSGDLIFSRNATVGEVAEVADWHPPFAMGQDVCLLRKLDPQASTGFLRAALTSRLAAEQLAQIMVGATFKRVNVENIRNLTIVFPPAAEQAAIAAAVDAADAESTALIEAAEQAGKLLQERRAAVISSAVTGRIDVRTGVLPAKLKFDRARLRLVVAATIAEAVAGKPNSGRTKQHKIAFLTQAHAGVHELDGTYLRKAAGPLDAELLDCMERELESAGHVRIEQPAGPGTQVTYKLLGKRGAFRSELEAALGARTEVLDKLIADLGGLDTRHVEAVATLYAVWNDALLDGGAPSDDVIVSAFLSDWHPQKAQKFRALELHTWLGWMRRHGLVPRGEGRKTSLGRLFV